MKKIANRVPWDEEVPILTGDLEHLCDYPRTDNPANKSFYDIADRFKLEDSPNGMTSFRPIPVRLDRLSPRNMVNQLLVFGLKPAPLRHYLSLERWIAKSRFDLRDNCIVYAGEFLPDGNSQSQRTFSFCKVWKDRDDYKGFMISCFPESFMTPGRMEFGYQFDQYVVAMSAD